MRQRKVKGEKIHSTWAILDYQKGLLQEEALDWTCVAGYKDLFISFQGKFRSCSMFRTEIDMMDVTPELLESYYFKKECQTQAAASTA